MFSDIDPWTNRPYESAGPSNAGSQFPANPGPTGGASVPSNSAFGGRGTSASRNRYGLGDFRNYRSTAPVNVESDEELNTGPGAPASARFAPRRENVAPVTIDEIAARARGASRSAPRFEVPAFEEGDDPQAYVEYFEDECNAYGLDINMKKSALKRAILEANKKGKQRTYWRNFIQAKPSYAQMKREFIDYYEDYVKAERDWDSALRNIEQGDETAKQYKIEFSDLLTKAQRYRKAIGYPKISNEEVMRMFVDGIYDDSARTYVMRNAVEDTWESAANELEIYEKAIPKRRKRIDRLARRSMEIEKGRGRNARIAVSQDAKEDDLTDKEVGFETENDEEKEVGMSIRTTSRIRDGPVIQRGRATSIVPDQDFIKQITTAVRDEVRQESGKEIEAMRQQFNKMEIFMERLAKERGAPNPSDERRYEPRPHFTFKCWNCGGNHRKDVCDQPPIGNGYTFREPRYERFTNNSNPNAAPIGPRRDFQ